MTNREAIRKRYFEESHSKFSPKGAEKRINIWDRVAAVESEIGKQLEDGFTKDDFIEFFEKLKLGQKILTFYSNKTIITNYLVWLIKNGLAETELNVEIIQAIKFEEIEYSDDVRVTYFKDFDSLQEAIKVAIQNAEKPDDSVHDVAVAAIYLAWYGVSIEEACEVKKRNLNDIDGTITIEPSGESAGRIITVPSSVMKLLSEYRDAEYYETQARYKTNMPYKASGYLLRTPKTAQLTVGPLRNILVRFSRYIFDGTKFMYSRIFQSGVFNRVYAEELVNGALIKKDYARLAEVFREDFRDIHEASNRLREYKSWKAMFYQAK